MIRRATWFLLLAMCVIRPGSAAPDNPPAAVAQAAQAASSEAAVEAGFLLPGDYAQSTTLAQLQARFGKANVKVTGLPGEGGFYHRVVLFPDDPSRRAYVDFYDDKPLSGVASITVRDRGSRWRGKHSVHVGMSFAELRKLNGKQFNFHGFDSDLRGWTNDSWSPALDDDDGRLGRLDVGEGEHMYFDVELGLREAAKQLPAGAWPVDENSVSSDDPRYPRLAELVVVTAITASTSLDDEWE